MMPVYHMNSFGTPPNGQPRKNGYCKHTPPGKDEKKPQGSTWKNTDLDLELKLDLKNASFDQIPDLVKKYQGRHISLRLSGEVSDTYLDICGLDGTDYLGEGFELESWEELYLPKPTKMEVLGVLDSRKGVVPFPQWVLLVGEDGRVYGYEDKELHLLAYSLTQLLQDGIQETGISYGYPTDLSDVEEEVLQKDEEIQRLRQKTREFIDQDADEFNEFLDMF